MRGRWDEVLDEYVALEMQSHGWKTRVSWDGKNDYVCSPKGGEAKAKGLRFWLERVKGCHLRVYIWVWERKVIFLPWPKSVIACPVLRGGFSMIMRICIPSSHFPADITCSDSSSLFLFCWCSFFVVPISYLFSDEWVSGIPRWCWRGLQVFQDVVVILFLLSFVELFVMFFFGLDWCWSKRFHVDDCSSRWLSCPMIDRWSESD